MTFLYKLSASGKSKTIEYPLNLILVVFEPMDLDEILEKTNELDISLNSLKFT